MSHRSITESRSNRLARRKAFHLSTQTLARAFRLLGPTFFALAFVGAAHAQGTLDMSGATTLMNTFKTFPLLHFPLSVPAALNCRGARLSGAGSP